MIDQAVYGILSANAGVSALVGNRIMPFGGVLAQNPTLPFIIYHYIGNSPVATDCGDKVDYRAIQIDCIASTPAAATELAEAVRTAIQFYSGTVNGVKVTDVRMDDEMSDYDDVRDEYMVISDYTMRINRQA